MVLEKRVSYPKSFLAVAQRTKPRLNRYIPYRPHPKQTIALLSNKVLELFFGGAAGGGKSDYLLMAALQFVDVPGYSALIIRKSYKDLAKAGALMDRSKKWLSSTDAHWNGTDFRWTFPSGATIEFGYLDKAADYLQYDSAEYQFIGFDELTQFPERDYTYLFSRLRGTTDLMKKVPLRMRSASNPGGPGHDWVKHRFVDPVTRDDEVVFIPSRIEDNPSLPLDQYEKSLSKMDPVDRERKRAGNWDILEEGDMFRRDWFERTQDYPRDAKLIRYWDLASTASDRKGDPDFTAGVLMAAKKGQFWVIDVKHWRETPKGNENGIQTTAEFDGLKVHQYFEQEPGASGKFLADHIRRNVLPGYPVFFRKPTGDKVERAQPLSSAAEAGNIHIVRGRWNEKYLDELTLFPNPDYKDDQVDASSGAHSRLALKRRTTVRARSSVA
jgi:predicted phage terminase large subunit-like protein